MPKPQGPSKEYYEKLHRFRVSGLEELKIIFPFDSERKSICNCCFTPLELKHDIEIWNDNRGFFGFATHYIREISRILGIPLQFNLFPLSVSSKIVSRLDDAVFMIPAEKNVEKMRAYESQLVKCLHHILKAISLVPRSSDLIDLIRQIREVDAKMLRTLIPNITSA